MKKLNEFFFGIEKISAHDFLWFYGILTLAVVIVATTYLKTM